MLGACEVHPLGALLCIPGRRGRCGARCEECGHLVEAGDVLKLAWAEREAKDKLARWAAILQSCEGYGEVTAEMVLENLDEINA